VYCSELAAILMDKIRGSFNGVTWDKNPLDIELSRDLREYDFIIFDANHVRR
jgi:hypothetical protein